MRAAVNKLISPMYRIVRPLISRLYIYRMLREKKEIFLDVGAGDKKGGNGWTTVDMTRNCDIYWDLRRGLPFPDERIAKIYSSHFLEHLSFKEGQKFLDECLRVLTKGGHFSICVPDARIYIEAYFRHYDLDVDKLLGYRPAYDNTTRIDLVNYVAYMDGHHKYMFDKDNLVKILERKGFRNVHLREFDVNVDIKERDIQSIYAQAEK